MDTSSPTAPEALAPRQDIAPVLMRPDKQMKVSLQDWATIRSLAESGIPYEQIASNYPIKACSIVKKAAKERWATPRRVSKAKVGLLATDDPASLVATLWKTRGEETRQDVFLGASKALKRFFAHSPVPQSFQEAAIAKKMLDESINPPSEAVNHTSLNLAILTTAGFAPQRVSQPTVDV